jgi:hypothetical protein
MKRLIGATALALGVAAAPVTFAQNLADHEAHHPPQNAAPATGQPEQPTPLAAQPGTGGTPMTNMMGGMPVANMMTTVQMMQMMGPGIASIDHIEGRIAFLRTELKITEAQTSAWNPFANAKKLGEVRGLMMQVPGAGQQAPTMTERLDLQERWLLARLDSTRAIKAAFISLYGALSDEQKKTADELLAPHMGMGMMSMTLRQMPAQMMQPGLMMQPGQIMQSRPTPQPGK